MNRFLRRITSVRARLTIWNTVTFAIVLIAIGIVFRFLAQNYLLSALDREIERQANRMQETRTVKRLTVSDSTNDTHMVMKFVTSDGPLPRTFAVPRGAKSVHLEVIQDVAQVVGDKSGQFQYRSFDLTGKPFTRRPAELPAHLGVLTDSGVVKVSQQAEQYTPWDVSALQAALAGRESLSIVDSPGSPMRVMSLPLKDGHRIIGAAQIGAPLSSVYRDIAGLTRTLFLILPPALFVAGLAGVFLTDRALRPVKALTLAATGIRPDQLAQRLPVSGADEFDELAATFNRALDRVEVAFQERERMMDHLRRFTGDASHELRTPLTTIKANTGVALEDDTPSQEHIHALRQIDRAANRMTNLVEDLLLLARSDAGQLTETRKAVRLRYTLEEAAALLPDAAYGADIDLNGCSASHYIMGDADQLIRLFRNLLENARRYTPVDGSITVVSTNEENMVSIRIGDSGAGIAPEHLVHLGERFYRADTGRNRKHGGAGLGIAICRSIVLQHNGDLSIESTVGVGTTVTIHIPGGADSSLPTGQDFVISQC